MHLYLLCFGLGALVGAAMLVAFAALFVVLYTIEGAPPVDQPARLRIPSASDRETDLTLH